MNLVRDTWVLSGGLMVCRALRAVLFEHEILFLFEQFVPCFLCPCSLCTKSVIPPYHTRRHNKSWPERLQVSLMRFTDRPKNLIIAVERHVTCKAVLNYFCSVPVCSFDFHHYFFPYRAGNLFKGNLMMKLRRLCFINYYYLL